MRTHTHIRTHLFVCVCVSVCTYMDMSYVYVYVYVYVCMYMYVIYVCTLCIDTCVYPYIQVREELKQVLEDVTSSCNEIGRFQELKEKVNQECMRLLWAKTKEAGVLRVIVTCFCQYIYAYLQCTYAHL